MAPEEKLLDWLKTQDKDLRDLVSSCVCSHACIYRRGTTYRLKYEGLASAIGSLPPCSKEIR